MFSTCLENFLPFSSNLKLWSANSFILEGSKICRWERVNAQNLHGISQATLHGTKYNDVTGIGKKLQVETSFLQIFGKIYSNVLS